MGPVLTRFEDWTSRLDDFIDLRRATPFCWGSQDCCTFAADAVEAITGTDPLEELRGKWKTEKQADSYLKKLGGIGRGVIGKLGKPVPSTFARRGDVVLVEVGEVKALGICLGSIVAAPAPDGLVFVQMVEAHMAWRIG